MTKESFYNARNTLVDETSYVYDAAGKRLTTVKNLDTQTYKYDKGYQLDSTTGTNSEDYAYGSGVGSVMIILMGMSGLTTIYKPFPIRMKGAQ